MRLCEWIKIVTIAFIGASPLDAQGYELERSRCVENGFSSDRRTLLSGTLLETLPTVPVSGGKYSIVPRGGAASGSLTIDALRMSGKDTMEVVLGSSSGSGGASGVRVTLRAREVEASSAAPGDISDGGIRKVPVRDEVFGRLTGVQDVTATAVSSTGEYATRTFTIDFGGTFRILRNPFFPGRGEKAEFLIPEAASGENVLRVLDIRGNLIVVLDASKGGRIFWDGRDDGGRPVGSGVYIVVLQSGNVRRTAKVAVVR